MKKIINQLTDNMNTQQIREKAAAFLDEIREGVAKLLQEPGKGFEFGGIQVPKWDKEKNFGAVCSMSGWIPAIRPDLAEWRRYNLGDITELIIPNDGRIFYPSGAGIPIEGTIWYSLNCPNWQSAINEENLPANTTFQKVASLWQRTAERIRRGELDRFLIID